MGRHSTAHYFLEGLVDLGVEYIFANLGTDHVSLIEEMARWDKEGRKHPEMILCPHEVVAVHMAGGYALATGRAQAVLVHVDAGTANACMAIQNLFRYRLPVMLFAGRAPHTLHGELTGSRDTYVHFVQDPFDIASIVRPYVKWEYSLPSGVVVKEALARACAFAQSDPPGPVYMMLPRETLAEEWDEAAMPSYPPARYGSVQAGGIEPARAEAIAQALDGGGKSGRVRRLSRPQAAGRRGARPAGARPAASASPNSMRSISISRRTRRASPAPIRCPCSKSADLGLLLDSDVPFVPQSAKRAERDEMDPDRHRSAEGGFSDVGISDRHAHPGRLRDRAAAGARRGRSARRRRLSQARRRSHRKLERRTRGVAQSAAPPPAPTRAFQARSTPPLCSQRSSAKLSQDDVVLNEAIRNGPILQEHVTRTKPQSYVGLAGGGLGFSAAAWRWGLKLAQPERRIVQVIGDGGFHFSSPDSVYAVAQQYQIPILTVVLDNGGWQAVKSAVQRVYPKGIAAETDQFQSRLTSGRQGERRDFSDVAKAFGAHGECVTEPDELAAAIDRCLAALDDGKAAVLHVHVTRL